jgi:uncharacterized protein
MPAAFDAFFLPVPGSISGHRFCIFHPAQGTDAKGAVLYIHPFGEEMNKSRRMAALQSRALAQAGYAVLQIDLLGCGDSAGDFAEATWTDWVDDVLRASTWLTQRVDAPLWLWGLRVGCLVALEAAKHLQRPAHLLFWAPTVSGKQALQQFLRLKAAADMADGSAKAAMDGMRSQLAQGRAVEIAGYHLSPALANGLECATLTPTAAVLPSRGGTARLEWIELSMRDNATLSPVATKILDVYRETDGRFRARGHIINGPAFWQTVEIEDAPTLIAATIAVLVPDADQ